MSTIPEPGRSGRRGRVNVERVGFLGRVKPERLAEYRARHEQVWPDMLAALDRIAATEVNARWQRDMAPYFTELDGLPPDQGFKRVDEIFHVD
jgi:L-rhamnose mutarotase